MSADRRFRTATELAPALEDAHVSLGAALVESGDLDGAEAEFDLTLKNDPTTAEADTRVRIGKRAVYRKKKAFVLAVHEYQEALKLDVSNADAHNGLGLAYQDQSELLYAIEEVRKAADSRPDSVELRNNLGTAL